MPHDRLTATNPPRPRRSAALSRSALKDGNSAWPDLLCSSIFTFLKFLLCAEDDPMNNVH